MITMQQMINAAEIRKPLKPMYIFKATLRLFIYFPEILSAVTLIPTVAMKAF
jgi:hypothetical protein